MSLYQIFVPIIALIAILYIWSLAWRRNKSVWQACLWTAFWFGVCSIALWPRSLTFLSKVTGIQDQENAVFTTAIAFLSLMIFIVVSRIEELLRRHNRLVRYLALKEFKQRNDT